MSMRWYFISDYREMLFYERELRRQDFLKSDDHFRRPFLFVSNERQINQTPKRKRHKNMKTRISKLTPGSALMAIAALTVAFSFASGQTAEENQLSERTVQGVWRTMVTPINCQTGDPVAPAFPGLFTFNMGGTMSEYGISPGQMQTPALRSPGHGVWQRAHGPHGTQNYSFTFTFYRYDASGLFIGSQKITAALVLAASGNDFTTSSTVEIFDANGNLIGTGCARAAGTRFE